MFVPPVARRVAVTMFAVVSMVAALASCTSEESRQPATRSAGSGEAERADPTPQESADTTAQESAVSESTGIYSGEASPTSVSVSIPEPASTPVLPPSAGNITQTVAPTTVETKPTVALQDPVEFGGGVSASITSIVAAQAEAKIPGEVAGPGLALAVQIHNASATPIDLNNVVVELADSDGRLAGPITSGSQKPFNGLLAPGESATGDYLFTLGTDKRSPITVTVIPAGGKPVGVWKGDVKLR